MDVSSIAIQILGKVWYLIPIAIVVVIIKTPWFKGIAGEFSINVLTKMRLDKKEYHLVKNVILSTEDGSTQIDHIIVSVFGVFVVETKNIRGWIFGNEKEDMWTQKIYKHSNKFQNPLRQNYKHVKTLQELLGLRDEQIHSLVVFVGDSTFKTQMPNNVTYGGGYIGFIKSKRQRVLSPKEVAEVINTIETDRITPSYGTHIEHIKHVKNIMKEKQSELSQRRASTRR
jgi:restriction system protein